MMKPHWKFWILVVDIVLVLITIVLACIYGLSTDGLIGLISADSIIGILSIGLLHLRDKDSTPKDENVPTKKQNG